MSQADSRAAEIVEDNPRVEGSHGSPVDFVSDATRKVICGVSLQRVHSLICKELPPG